MTIASRWSFGLVALGLLLLVAAHRPYATARNPRAGQHPGLQEIGAAYPTCTEDNVDDFYDLEPHSASLPKTRYEIILPRVVKPFDLWGANHAYCSEVVMLQAGLAAGQFLSQYNVRKFCGSGLGQSGGDSWCADHPNPGSKYGNPNYNAQVGLEIPGTGTSGSAPFAHAGQCAANQRLKLNVYDGARSPSGMEGYRHFMSWVKGEFIKGRPVAMGLKMHGENDQQYDHVVNVQAIGTNHFPFTDDYHDDDVLIFDDNGSFSAWPEAPGVRCTPYYYRYTFKDLAYEPSKDPAWPVNQNSIWSIVVPNHKTQCKTKAGSLGVGPVSIQGPNNFGWSSLGPVDESGDLLPVHLEITASAAMGADHAWVANEPRPLVGFNYEDSTVYNTPGNCVEGPPEQWMLMTFAATASGLTVGQVYHMYQYVLDVSQSSGQDPLPVPTAQFNARATVKPHVFTATAATHTASFTATSDKVVVVRCVLASAP